MALAMLDLRDRRQVSLLVRQERYGRYLSCLVFVPRDRHSTDVRLKIENILMDAYEDRNKGLPHYIRHVKNWQRDYNFHWHFGPHDLKKTEFTNNRQVVDTAYDLGINFEVLPKADRASAIDNLRSFLKVLHVNENENTLHVLDMLASYRREYDDKNQVFKDTPVHDFASDSTDMMRYAAQSWEPTLLTTSTARKNYTAKRALG